LLETFSNNLKLSVQTGCALSVRKHNYKRSRYNIVFKAAESDVG